ncbi:MAG TPA: hypothetical protein VJB69_00550 [Candidatus Paceibacterota bacterium]
MNRKFFMAPKSVWLLIAVGLLIFIIFLLRAEKQLDNEAMHEIVNFCGIEYQAPIIIVNGVDVVKRIAEAASTEKNQETCKEIVGANKSKLTVVFRDFQEGGARSGVYSIHLNGYLFLFEEERTMIARPGEHGIEGWVSFYP